MVVASDFRNSHHIILNNNKVMLSDNIMVLIPVFFVLLLGYFAGRAKKFDADQVAGINELVLDFALPASLFTRIVSSSRTEITQHLSFILVSLAALLGIFVLGLVISRILFRLTISNSALFALGAAFPSAAFFGPAILSIMFGEKSVVTISFIVIVANLLLVPISLVILEADRTVQQAYTSGRTVQQVCTSWRTAQKICTSVMDTIYVKHATKEIAVLIIHSVSKAVKAPYVWAPAVGLVFVLLGIHISPLISSMFNLIGQTTSGLALFGAGLIMAAHTVRLNWVVAVNAMLKSVVQPSLMLVLLLIFGLHNPMASVWTVTVAMPTAVIVPIIASRYRTYQFEAGSVMVLTSVLLIVVIPAFMYLMYLFMKN
jgi:malonate transporter and related proteins